MVSHQFCLDDIVLKRHRFVLWSFRIVPGTKQAVLAQKLIYSNADNVQEPIIRISFSFFHVFKNTFSSSEK